MISNISSISFNGNLNCFYEIATKLKGKQAKALGKKFVHSQEKTTVQKLSQEHKIDLEELYQYVKTLPVDVELKIKDTMDKFSMVLLRPQKQNDLPNLFVTSGELTQKSLDDATTGLKKAAKSFGVDDGKPKQLSLLF